MKEGHDVKHDSLFASRLKALRERMGISQKEMAEKIGVSRQSVNYYENSERVPDFYVLNRICNETNCSIKYLFGYQEAMRDQDEGQGDSMNEYQALARRTQNPELNMVQRKEHALMGLVSKVGEICAHYQKVHQGHPLIVDDVIDELGDLMWFVAELCDVLRVSMDEVAGRNIDKLRSRYPEGFEAVRSLNREG